MILRFCENVHYEMVHLLLNGLYVLKKKKGMRKKLDEGQEQSSDRKQQKQQKKDFILGEFC